MHAKYTGSMHVTKNSIFTQNKLILNNGSKTILDLDMRCVFVVKLLIVKRLKLFVIEI